MGHVHTSQDSRCNDHFQEGLRRRSEKENFEQQENYPKNKLLERLGEHIPFDNWKNQPEDTNHVDMKMPSNIVIYSTTLTGRQSSAQIPLENTSPTTMTGITRKYVMQVVPVLRQSNIHISYQDVAEENENKNHQFIRSGERLQDHDERKKGDETKYK